MDLNLTVEEYLFDYASEEELEERSQDSKYWTQVLQFVHDRRDTLLSELSFKQRNWLIKIREDLIR